jgi:hypothetical protein
LPEQNKQTEAEFYQYWEPFLPRYLSGNFGDGHYTLLHQAKGKSKYPTLQFVAVGIHNGGGGGSIYGRAISFGSRVAVVYALRKNTPQQFESFENLPGFDIFNQFANSLTPMKTSERRAVVINSGKVAKLSNKAIQAYISGNKEAWQDYICNAKTEHSMAGWENMRRFVGDIINYQIIPQYPDAVSAVTDPVERSRQLQYQVTSTSILKKHQFRFHEIESQNSECVFLYY